MIAWLLVLRGRLRLRHGYCPWCESYPPRPGCPVCACSATYGAGLTIAERETWMQRWRHLIDTLR